MLAFPFPPRLYSLVYNKAKVNGLWKCLQLCSKWTYNNVHFCFAAWVLLFYNKHPAMILDTAWISSLRDDPYSGGLLHPIEFLMHGVVWHIQASETLPIRKGTYGSGTAFDFPGSVALWYCLYGFCSRAVWKIHVSQSFVNSLFHLFS